MSDRAAGLTVIVGVLLFLAALVGGSLALKNARCEARFQDSDLEARWSVMAGCQVKVPGHGWLPADNYRVLP